MPREVWMNRCTGSPLNRGHRPVRWLCPIKIWVIPRERANSRSVATGSSPSRISTWAPAAWAAASFPSRAACSEGEICG